GGEGQGRGGLLQKSINHQRSNNKHRQQTFFHSSAAKRINNLAGVRSTAQMKKIPFVLPSQLLLVVAVAFAFSAMSAITVFSAAEDLRYTGVNLAGAEFGANVLPGTYNTQYTYPNQ